MKRILLIIILIGFTGCDWFKNKDNDDQASSGIAAIVGPSPIDPTKPGVPDPISKDNPDSEELVRLATSLTTTEFADYLAGLPSLTWTVQSNDSNHTKTIFEFDTFKGNSITQAHPDLKIKYGGFPGNLDPATIKNGDKYIVTIKVTEVDIHNSKEDILATLISISKK